MKTTYQILFLLISLAFLGCNANENEANNKEGSTGLSIIATTGQINSALEKIIAGTEANIQLLCGPGVDPHSYSASPNDVQSMLNADLVAYNGFHLEAKLGEHLDGESLKDKSFSMASAFPMDSRMEWKEDGKVDPDAPFDPHIWNHLPGWSKCVTALAGKLAELDSANADKYKENAAVYVNEINETHEWATAKLAKLPEDRRVLVSAHDAFNYFTDQYGMEPLAVLGIGNDPDADILTMKNVAEQICEKKIPAIFMESITNPKVTQALKEACASRDWEVEIVAQTLYSDDLGEKAPQDTFLGAFRSNVEVIFDSLSK